jgi:hypothetical protein
LTLLLTFLATRHLATYVIPLPSRLHIADENALGLYSASGLYSNSEKSYWKIFQDFLDSGDPLALDERRYATASLTCLKILFGQYQAPVLRFTWLIRHSRTLRGDIEARYQRNHTDLPVEIDWRRSIRLYWGLRTHLPNQMRRERDLSGTDILFGLMVTQTTQYRRSSHLQFLLEKSAYSDNILDFARHRVFRFGYLARQHPTYMKKAIFSLAKYIQRVTGETAEVRACESIWGRDRWFTAQ